MLRFNVLIPLLAVLLAGCGTARVSSEEKQQAAEAATEQMQMQLADRHFRIDVTQMYPRRGPGRYVGAEFYVALRGDTVDSYLPYIGEVYYKAYTGGENLNFTSKVRNYSSARKKGGKTVITFDTRSNEDAYRYRLTVYDNGLAEVAVSAQGRDGIRYDGDYAD